MFPGRQGCCSEPPGTEDQELATTPQRQADARFNTQQQPGLCLVSKVNDQRTVRVCLLNCEASPAQKEKAGCMALKSH